MAPVDEIVAEAAPGLTERQVPAPFEYEGTVEDRYTILEVNGSGVYGAVYKAEDKLTQALVAIKRIHPDDEGGGGGLPSHVVREVTLLRGFSHPNIVELIDVIFRVGGECALIFEYIELDLYRELKQFRKSGELMPMHQVQSYARDIIRAISACHDLLITHRDLKPQNILVGPQGLKLCDFGLARQFSVPPRTATYEVVTLWYRAPELLLGCNEYGPQVDTWSIGCVVAEMATGLPLFAGDSEIGTIFKIFKLLGTPTEEVWPGLLTMFHWSNQFPRWPPTGLDVLIASRPELGEPGRELLQGLLTLCPARRIFVRTALRHTFLKEGVFDRPISTSMDH